MPPKIAFDKTHVVELLSESMPYTVHDARWVPTSRRFVVVGSRPRATGALQVYKMNTQAKTQSERMEKISDVETDHAIKCCTFAACDPIQRHCAIGDFNGYLQVYDLLKPNKPVFTQQIHQEIINCIDGGGAPGPCEYVTGSRDGRVHVSDIRCQNAVVASLVPDGDRRDCWTVSMGGTTGPQDRTVAAGFDNGDVKLWDLRSSSISWQTNLRNGVVSMQLYDRAGPLKGLIAGCLSGQIVTFDLTNSSEEKGYASKTQKIKDSATVWVVQRCPQKKDIIATTGGSGELIIWKKDKKEIKLDKIASSQLSTQPISSFDWHPDKEGLAITSAFDQTVRILYVTHLNEK
ncbi:WD repeat-containing protein 92 [Histomonas meleagridis]|uniref:WD repeat-containing protein 92 n=1 Tax=Histomonas meleagridis TaxID=135588 RepID=UPI003559C9C4|nr:WD repeat-containing protein 92 [Histomonas meleagridis]KAH0796378.1 WD repeat-containing protein 92 [Histomonas meleagridis]